jgi:hypothetical protein
MQGKTDADWWICLVLDVVIRYALTGGGGTFDSRCGTRHEWASWCIAVLWAMKNAAAEVAPLAFGTEFLSHSRCNGSREKQICAFCP